MLIACVPPPQIHVYSLETGKAVACVGDSPGDFTCIHLDEGNAPHMMVCGNKDRRWVAYANKNKQDTLKHKHMNQKKQTYT